MDFGEDGNRAMEARKTNGRVKGWLKMPSLPSLPRISLMTSKLWKFTWETPIIGEFIGGYILFFSLFWRRRDCVRRKRKLSALYSSFRRSAPLIVLFYLPNNDLLRLDYWLFTNSVFTRSCETCSSLSYFLCLFLLSFLFSSFFLSISLFSSLGTFLLPMSRTTLCLLLRFLPQLYMFLAFCTMPIWLI